MKQAPTGHGSNSCSSKWMPSFSFEVPPLQLHLLEYPWSWISSWGPSWDAPLKFLFVLTLSQNKRKKKVHNMHLLQVGNFWVGCWGWVQDGMSLELELPSGSLAQSVVNQTQQTPAWCSCSILCAAAQHIRRHKVTLGYPRFLKVPKVYNFFYLSKILLKGCILFQEFAFHYKSLQAIL